MRMSIQEQNSVPFRTSGKSPKDVLLGAITLTRAGVPFAIAKGPSRNKCAVLGVEAPVWQGVRSAHTGEYVSDEQRSQAGCIGGQDGAVIS